MLSQTSYGQYFMQSGVKEEVADSINDFFAQLTWTEEEPAMEDNLAQTAVDEELEEMADFLAQLDDEQMERLNELIQTKRSDLESEDEF